MEPTILVVSSDGALRRALVSQLSAALPLNVEAHANLARGTGTGPSGIVVVPAAELTLSHCRGLVQEGLRVVVLAAFPRQIDQESYIDAGAAAYLPMTTDPAPLLEAIIRVSESVPG